MNKFLRTLLIGGLVSTLVMTIQVNASHALPALTTCTDLSTDIQVVLRVGQHACPSSKAVANWHVEQSNAATHGGASFAKLRICSELHSKDRPYQVIRKLCKKYQRTTDYYRAVASPTMPTITDLSTNSYDHVFLSITTESTNTDSPITYYLIKNLTDGTTTKVLRADQSNFSQISIKNLHQLTKYTFTITAVNVDNTSATSPASASITTGAIPVPLANPTFTLSSGAGSTVVGNSVNGYTISSTGGEIATYSISPAISTTPGLSFSTSTGLISGTPSTVAAAQTYTITATNASGSSNATFTLTVTASGYSIGSTGPGGGTVFYYLASGFDCGTTFSSTGSPTGGLCHYLEVAPNTWSGSSDPTKLWAVDANQTADVLTITIDGSPLNASAAIGLGYKNSLAIVAQGNDATTAAGAARGYTGGSKSDWYLPTTAELNQLCKWARGVAWTSDATVCIGGTLANGGFVAGRYWSSSESGANVAWIQSFNDGSQYNGTKDVTCYVRPVRAF
jgi:hypothetical protein